ncbi:MAG: hypothetical protein J7M39_14910, partial [Anaerolineae bacterium]|nr:hypothetical protein [Anaerolineae bacterium]
SSTGGLSAGRANAESALFPYTTDDKLTENAGNTGHVAIFLVSRGERTTLWEPFSARYLGVYAVERNLYKTITGDKLIFEEINHDRGLTYRYAWRTSDRYGFVKTGWLRNDSGDGCDVALIDGLQNLLPYGATTALQSTFSNLLNAYKRNELDPDAGVGMFSLSSTLTDLAEPSESLKTTTVWQVGLDQPRVLLSTRQLDAFRRGEGVCGESDVRGYRGAYLVNTVVALQAGEEREWSLVAEVNQDSSSVASLINALKRDRNGVKEELERDIAQSTAELVSIVAGADGLQLSGDRMTAAHHFANVLFNTMRGGIFADNTNVDKPELLDFMRVRNRPLLKAQRTFFDALPDTISYGSLRARAAATEVASLQRLCDECLPITFSRRHGDPSRPWNQFSINLKKPDGSRRLDYQGNWRDIFQNWEALTWSYPEFVEGVISKFVNATTADGYNPYRVTRDGIEWEAPAPDDPWANIGYWSDHQIIYLQKLLEMSARFHPGRLQALLGRRIFSHANVPYRIKPYTALLADWYDTIEFDRVLDEEIAGTVSALGTDGKLVLTDEGEVLHVTLAEKLLILLLAKLGNFVPEGGIWMNTQRPEWNDANNALVGKGLSLVTACYLRRTIAFYRDLVAGVDADVAVMQEVGQLLTAMGTVLEAHRPTLQSGFTDEERRVVLDGLGQACSDYRWQIYEHGVSGEVVSLDKDSLVAFLDLALQYVEHTLRANKRPDGLYHAYNILSLGDGADALGPPTASVGEPTAVVGHLYEILEGQVAMLSSGMLSSEESLALLQGLRKSAMYRADQHSYMLYPDRDLPGFLRKNCMSEAQVAGSKLIAKLVEAGDRTLILRDENGVTHFNGAFRNAKGVEQALADLREREAYADLVDQESALILELFEDVFQHSQFTGRSGTFFAFEGLGSIYWHMVSKLLLAAEESYLRAVEQGADQAVCEALLAAYYDIRQGLGFNKSPEEYGAFPTDPYSHTPAGQGAKQPGMTGLVKEEILTRLGELGVVVDHGVLAFKPTMLRASEFLDAPARFDTIDLQGGTRSLDLPAGALAFTYCQVPVVYLAGEQEKIEVHFADGSVEDVAGNELPAEISASIFKREGRVVRVAVYTRVAV